MYQCLSNAQGSNSRHLEGGDWGGGVKGVIGIEKGGGGVKGNGDREKGGTLGCKTGLQYNYLLRRLYIYIHTYT